MSDVHTSEKKTKTSRKRENRPNVKKKKKCQRRKTEDSAEEQFCEQTTGRLIRQTKSEQTNERTNAGMNRRASKRTNEGTNERANERKSEFGGGGGWWWEEAHSRKGVQMDRKSKRASGEQT